MSAPATLSASGLRAVMARFKSLLDDHREVINRLNVYPVPDGDTGTNMALTLSSVATEVDALPADASMAALKKAIGHGSLMGARGNSGVILSQLLRGLTSSFPDEGDIDGPTLVAALKEADESARRAVARPIEGTILSVARGAAVAASEAPSDLLSVARAARDGSLVALAYTPEQLAVLKQAGVVDSGGTGLTLLFHAFCHELGGDELPVAPEASSIDVHVSEAPAEGHDVGDLRYEVMYLLDADDAKMPAFREVWNGVGDSIVIVGGDGFYNCHIHTDDIGAAIEAALDAGRPRDIRVTDLAEQVVEERWVREGAADATDVEQTPPPATAVVAVVVGDGIGRIFSSLGVRQLVRGGQSLNPSTQELVDAVRATGSSEVILLPNNKNIRAVAEQVDALVTQTVRVVPTNSMVEGFAALLNYDPDESAEANAASMSESASNVIAAEVTQAVRDTGTDVGQVHVGDWIGLSREGIRSVADSVSSAATKLLDALITPTHELVTLIEGEGSSAANTRRITEHLADEFPQISVEVHHGGQPLYPYLFGVE